MQQEPPGFASQQQNYVFNSSSSYIDAAALAAHLSGLNFNNSNNMNNNSDNHHLSYSNGVDHFNSSNNSENNSIAVPYIPLPRTGLGSEGKSIRLRANHFIMNIPKGFLYQYNVTITPDKCPKRINRFVRI